MFGVGKWTIKLAIAAALLVSIASAAPAQPLKASFAAVGEETSIPYGWVDFCSRYARECDDDDRAPQPIPLTAAAMRTIQRINVTVNHEIEAVSDMDHWGVVDQWDYPTDGRGDCEDFALLKRKLLMKAGFPRQALLMTVVKEANGEGHAILTVKTDQGDFALDNLDDTVKPWNRTPYRFVKRQSETNQNIWVAIGAPTAAPAYVSK
ncbi:MAG: transglutaminase-like cysteine peptidase [Methylocystis sp.]